MGLSVRGALNLMHVEKRRDRRDAPLYIHRETDQLSSLDTGKTDNFSSINPELIKRIFSYLDEPSKKSSPSVCKMWRALLLPSIPVNDLMLLFLKSSSDLIKKLESFFLRDNRFFLNVVSAKHLNNLVRLLFQRDYPENWKNFKEWKDLLESVVFFECKEEIQRLEGYLSGEIKRAPLIKDNFSKVLSYYLLAKRRNLGILLGSCQIFINNYFQEAVTFSDFDKCGEISLSLSHIYRDKNTHIPLTLNLSAEKNLPRLSFEKTHDRFFEVLNSFSPNLISLNLKLKPQKSTPPVFLQENELKYLKKLEHLQALSLNFKSNEEGFAHLSHLKELISLELRLAWPTRLNFLSTLTNLTSLNLSRSPIENDDLLPLLQLSKLINLKLNHCEHITEKGLENLKSLELISLGVNGTRISYQGLDHLLGFINLRSLNLKKSPTITAASLEKLQSLTQLNFLNLSRCLYLKDPGLEFLNFSHLTSLKLNRCFISGWGFKGAELPNLTSLSLAENSISDSSLENFLPLSKLSSLNLSKCKFLRNCGEITLNKFTSLISLNLSECNIPDEGLLNLRTLVNLTHLNLSGCSSITDDGLIQLLKELPLLIDIKVSNSKIMTGRWREFIKDREMVNSRMQLSRRKYMYSFDQISDLPDQPSTNSLSSGWYRVGDQTPSDRQRVNSVYQNTVPTSSTPPTSPSLQRSGVCHSFEIENRMLNLERNFSEQNQRIGNLESANEVLNGQLKIKDDELKALRDELEKTRDANAKLIEELRERIVNLENDNKLLQNDNKLLQDQIKEKDEEIKKLKVEIEKARKEKKEASKKIKEINQGLRSGLESLRGQTKESDESGDDTKGPNEPVNDSEDLVSLFESLKENIDQLNVELCKFGERVNQAPGNAGFIPSPGNPQPHVPPTYTQPQANPTWNSQPGSAQPSYHPLPNPKPSSYSLPTTPTSSPQQLKRKQKRQRSKTAATVGAGGLLLSFPLGVICPPAGFIVAGASTAGLLHTAKNAIEKNSGK